MKPCHGILLLNLLSLLLAIAPLQAAPTSQPASAGEADLPGQTTEQQNVEQQAAAPPASLEQLAAAADVIAVAQIKDTDYLLRREFPVAGSAYLKMLIPYKVDKPLDIIEVFEEGLHPNECYFPNPSVFEEGRRYLLFLRVDPDKPERYRALPQGCALDLLVRDNSQYALRLPVTGIALSDPLTELAQEMDFSDPYALETDESLASQQRDEWLEAGWLQLGPDGYVYTHGVELAKIRQLMGEQAISLDRHQKRVER